MSEKNNTGAVFYLDTGPIQNNFYIALTSGGGSALYGHYVTLKDNGRIISTILYDAERVQHIYF